MGDRCIKLLLLRCLGGVGVGKCRTTVRITSSTTTTSTTRFDNVLKDEFHFLWCILFQMQIFVQYG